jgi:ABC-type dipeptide/oligopeptide/nickel transport system permease subunit
VLAALYASDDPASAAERISKTYEILKTQFDSTEYLALLAIMLYDLVSETEAERIAERSKTLYKMMKKQHPILTSSSATLLVGFMSFSEKSDEELVNDCEECYKLLKKTFPNHEDADQSCAQILSMTTSSPEVKTERFIELFEAFKEAGRKYSKGYELAILAALSISDASISEIVETVLEIDSELAAKKGYTGIFGTDKSTRIIHAAMLATIVFGERTNLNVGIPAVSLVMMMAHLIAELVMLTVIAANDSATTC